MKAHRSIPVRVTALAGHGRPGRSTGCLSSDSGEERRG